MTSNNTKTKYKRGDLVVWHIAQIPGPQFRVKVDDLRSAKLILDTLANYDSYQYQNKIKGDYASAGGLLVWDSDLEPDEDGERFTEWADEHGNSIDNVENLDRAIWEMDVNLGF